MLVMSPNDNRVKNGASSDLKDRKFSGNRQVTDNVQKDEDYTKPSMERRTNLKGENTPESELIAPSTTKDIDDLNDPEARKREVSRRAETSDFDSTERKYREEVDDYTGLVQSDPENRPRQDSRDDEEYTVDPNKKHGTRNPWRIGEDHDKRGDQNTGPTTKPR